jgi:hypothetical protein
MYYRLRDTIELKPAVASSAYKGRAFPGKSRSQQFVEDDRALAEVIGNAAGAAGKAVDGMAQGEFPLTRPELVEEVCRSCSFRTVCRIQTLKHVSPAPSEES